MLVDVVLVGFVYIWGGIVILIVFVCFNVDVFLLCGIMFDFSMILGFKIV